MCLPRVSSIFLKKISPKILDRNVFHYNVGDFYPQVVHDTIRFPNAVGSQGII